MSWQQIHDYLESVCDDDIFNLNFRGWDFEKIMQHGEFLPSDSVLDTGALDTYFSIYLSQYVDKLTVTDSFAWAERAYFSLPIPYMNNRMPPTIKEWGEFIVKHGKGNITVEMADVTHLPYADNSFDKVLSISTIEHVKEDRVGMEEMMRVIKPNGLLLLTTEYNEKQGKPYCEEEFIKIYDKKSLKELVRGFEVEYQESLPLAENDWNTVFLKVRKRG